MVISAMRWRSPRTRPSFGRCRAAKGVPKFVAPDRRADWIGSRRLNLAASTTGVPFEDGTLVALPTPDLMTGWLPRATPRPVQRLWPFRLAQHRGQLIELISIEGAIDAAALDSLIEFVVMLSRIYRRSPVLATRISLDQFGPAPAVSLLRAGVTVVLPYETDASVAEVKAALPGAVLQPYSDGRRVIVRGMPPPAAEDWSPFRERRYDDDPGWHATRALTQQNYERDWEPPRRQPEPAPRVLNLFVTDESFRQVVGGVGTDVTYLLRIGIGAQAARSILAHDQQFPDEQLPRARDGWELDVVAFGREVRIDSAPRNILLPTTGPSWVCDCPWRAARHVCSPEDRRPWLDIPFEVRPSARAPMALLGIYYGAALLQVAEVSLTVGDESAAAPIATTAYCRDPEFLDLSLHRGRGLSAYLAPAPAGRHLVVVNNGRHRPVTFEFGDEQTATAATAMRQVLYDTHLDADRRPREPDEVYLTGFRQLATMGARVYRSLLVNADDERRLQRWLAEAGDKNGALPIIQLARAAGSRMSLPWQLLYDLPLPGGWKSAKICASVEERGPGRGGPEAPPRCPHEETHDRDRGVLCPFGFWGLSHIIEAPPTTRGELLPRDTSSYGPAELIAAVNPTLSRYEAHLARLRSLLGDTAFPVATTWPGLRSVAATGADLLYFYCHGRFGTVDDLPQHVPILELGDRDHDRITPDRLSQWSARWFDRRPLVLLNGCGSGESLPDLLATFVDAFVNSLSAAGVIATEIAVESSAAQSVAEALLRQIWTGRPIGAAVQAMRWELLSQGSFLGLAYTPHCDAYLSVPVRHTYGYQGASWPATSSSASGPRASASPRGTSPIGPFFDRARAHRSRTSPPSSPPWAGAP